MNPLKSLQERVILLSNLPKNPPAMDRVALHLMGFGKVEDLVSWTSNRGRQHALATFATTDGSKRALQASSIKTMYGEFGMSQPSPDMWKFLNPSSSGSTQHIPLTATPSAKEEEVQNSSVPINTAPALVAMEKRIKEMETMLATSRQSWTASFKTIEEDVRQLKELYGGLLGNSGATEGCDTAKVVSRDTTCGAPRTSQDTNDHLIRLLSIIVEKLKRGAT